MNNRKNSSASTPNKEPNNDRDKLHVRGLTSLTGNKFVKARKRNQRAFIPYHEFMVGGHATTYLREQKFVLTGPHYRDLTKQVDDLKTFPRAPLLERPGWTDCYFSFPCGKVISPPTRPKGKAIFTRTPGKCAKGGEGPQWRDSVAGLVADQSLPAFLVMVAFAAPLLRLTDRVDNFGFEVVGERGTGKTTILRLMSTVAGAGIDAGEGVYWQTLGATIAGLETTMQRHQDLPMILDEAGLFMPKEGKTDRASSMVSLAFQLGSGHTRARWGDPQPAQYRFIFAISSNEPASQTMRGNNQDREAAALDRLLTLPIPAGEFGVFDSLPERYASGAAFSAAIDAAMRRHYGRALPRFVELLVKEKYENEPRIRRKIVRLMRQFRQAASVNANNGSAVRVCDAFGLVYAAGTLARSYNILPNSYDCQHIALEMYHRHLASRDDRTSIDKILDLAQSPRILFIPERGQQKLTLSDIEDHDGLVFESRNGKELLLTKSQFRRLFPLLNSPKSDGALYLAITRDSDHLTVKRTVSRSLNPLRFFCFCLDRLQE